MGRVEKEGNDLVYRQDDGEITAVQTGFEETMELRHEGSRNVKNVFYLFVAGGFIYLACIFLL